MFPPFSAGSNKHTSRLITHQTSRRKGHRGIVQISLTYATFPVHHLYKPFGAIAEKPARQHSFLRSGMLANTIAYTTSVFIAL